MSETVSDFMLKRLSAWGIKRIFGYPGDGILGIMVALERNKELFEFVQVRHEEMAALMASAHAKYTGELGFCLATSGPGAIRLLNGLYDAKMDHQPVLAIVGQAARTAIGGNYQQATGKERYRRSDTRSRREKTGNHLISALTRKNMPYSMRR